MVETCHHQHFRRHPGVGRPLLIPRLGSRQQALQAIARRVGCPTISAPAASVAWHYAQPMFESGSDEQGLLLDPQTHALQWNVSSRPVGLKEHTEYGQMRRIRPEKDEFTGEALRQLLDRTIAPQIGGGGTILKAPSFFVRGPGTRGRDLDLRVQEAAVKLFEGEGMEEPHPLSGMTLRRELYATIALPVEEVRSQEARKALIASYTGLAVDGFDVVLVGFHHEATTEDVTAGTSFLTELSASGGRPVLSQCPGHLAHLLLISGVSCSIGIASGERSRMEPIDTRVQGPTARSAYHPALMRGFQLPTKKISGRTSKRVFSKLGCDCGEHDQHVPPTNAELPRHTLRARAGAFKEAMAESDRDLRLAAAHASLIEATHIAAEIDVPRFSIAVADAFLAAALDDDEQQQAA